MVTKAMAPPTMAAIRPGRRRRWGAVRAMNPAGKAASSPSVSGSPMALPATAPIPEWEEPEFGQ